MMEKRTKNASRKTNGRAGRDEKSTWNNKKKGNMKYDGDKKYRNKNSIKIYTKKRRVRTSIPKKGDEEENDGANAGEETGKRTKLDDSIKKPWAEV